ncbi:MAG: isoprenylcysteine carboxylmethyltransferase family protein [Pseudomonadota bacterium]
MIRHWLDMPPVWLAGFAALAWLLAPSEPPGASMLWVGRGVIALGLGLALWAALAFRRARTTIVPKSRPAALVESGPFRFSRNPIYLADLVILAGWSLSLGAPWTLGLLVPFWWVLEHRFIRGEEAVLTADLGEPYRAYCTRVRRWL